MANFEVIAWKKDKRTVRYYALPVNGEVATQLTQRFQDAGYTDIQVRMI